MRNMANVGPEIGNRASVDASVQCDTILDDIGRAPSNPLYLLITWQSPSQHVELPRSTVYTIREV